jgi:pimeloyl-ACP methyl ester carboxylesterase
MQVTVGGVHCRYLQEGEGQDVLLLHGWGGKAESFFPLFNALKGRCRVTAIDFAGHGESGRPAPDGWSVTDYMEWTAGVIRALGIGPCDVVAHSFGGRVAILLSATYPELVRRLVLTGAHGIVGKRTAKQRLRSRVYKILRTIAGVLPGGKKLRAKLADHFGSSDYKALDEEMRRTFVKVINQDLTGYLPSIKASTLLVWGDKDEATPLWFGQLMEREIPDAGLVVYEGCGHYAYLERAADFNRVVAHFLLEE